ncbi:MAG: hypothetical protein MJE77_39745 [Proteobacteria bacterium]|nr:hypothetical protein [Pseudomonadota bacterium]
MDRLMGYMPGLRYECQQRREHMAHILSETNRALKQASQRARELRAEFCSTMSSELQSTLASHERERQEQERERREQERVHQTARRDLVSQLQTSMMAAVRHLSEQRQRRASMLHDRAAQERGERHKQRADFLAFMWGSADAAENRGAESARADKGAKTTKSRRNSPSLKATRAAGADQAARATVPTDGKMPAQASAAVTD